MRKPYLVREAEPVRNGKNQRVKKFTCTHCGNDATTEALFRSRGVILIEKYCADCLQTEKFSSIMSFYASTEN